MAISGGDGSIILTTKVDESGLKKGFGSMKSLAAGLTKSIAAIGVAAGAATVAITKMAVSAYADYEQLVGGVETLFKGSAQKVIDYANDAFYTAGVSANEYMKQVTSFSASLIRSTAGDTEKAADIANMALIDISDNVNKMGSSMESVTMAYQGFAKQQYMLLDNLKLGYGGTKTEMERLLKDAQTLTGVKYDINNLGDVYQAIHAIQEELGITGTTAKEAEKTITGSANMMKAAWKNVLAAIAGGGDLDRAINNLVYSVQKYFENIVPVVQRSLVGIGQLIEKVAPMLIQNVASALIQAIPSLINAIYQMIVGLAKGIWEGIKALFTGKTGSVTADIKTSVGGISNSLGNVGSAASDASNGMDELGKSTKAAGKEAKKSLAAFDDLNIIAENAMSGAGGVGGTGGISAGGIDIDTSGISEANSEIEELTADGSVLNTYIQQLTESLSGLRDIDLTNLSTSLQNLKQPLSDLVDISWDILLWGIKNVIVPLTKFTIEEVLPRFFDSLAIALQGFKAILENGFKLFVQFYEEFLKPIAIYAADNFLELWDTLNEELTKFVNLIENSTAWEDLKTILGAIYRALKPAVKYLLDFVAGIGKLTIKQSWITLRWIFKDIEDLLGFIAGLINGDFGDAWDHLKDLMIDNKIDYAKESLDNLKTSFDNVKAKVEEFVIDWAERIDEIVKTWQTKISDWWKNDVEPWFTLERWGELFFTIGAAIANAVIGVGGFIEIWKTNILDWWKNDVEPWFTLEKWQEIFKNMVKSLVNFFIGENGFIQTWKTEISNWWNYDVTPWFTVEKWKEFGTSIKDGILSGFNGVVDGISKIINKVIDGFQGLANGAIGMINKVIEGWNSVADKTPGLKSLEPRKEIDLSKYKIKGYAAGTIVPPNMPHLAWLGDNKKEPEVVSPLSTMKQAFTEAMIEMGGNFGGGNTEVVLEIDGREFGRAVVEQGNRESRRIGTRLVLV